MQTNRITMNRQPTSGILGQSILVDPISPDLRRHDLKVIVPMSNEIRNVEAFNASPSKGVQEIITGDNSTFRYLRMSRIYLDKGNSVSRSLAMEEAIYYINNGETEIGTGGSRYSLSKGDVLYVGINSEVQIKAIGPCDLSEYKAIDCHTWYPAKMVRHSDIEGTDLAIEVGNKRPMSKRTVYKLIDTNVLANRLLFGDTQMRYRGGIGSYPPHFHGPDGPYGLGHKAKEEIYHFRCASDIEGEIPYVLQNCALPEEKVNVYAHIFDDMAINVTPSYHDTIAPPSVEFMFVWCLASFTEGHRDWSEMVNKPGYENEW